MSHGAIIYNTNGDILVDADYPAMVEVKRGTLQMSASNGPSGLKEYAFLATTETSGDPDSGGIRRQDITELQSVVFLRLPVGGHVKVFHRTEYPDETVYGHISFDRVEEFYGIASNLATVDYVLAVARDRLDPPIGQGLAFYGRDGGCTFSEDVSLGYITEAFSSIPVGTTVTHSLGSEYVGTSFTEWSMAVSKPTSSTTRYQTTTWFRPNATQVRHNLFSQTTVNEPQAFNDLPITHGLLIGKF